MDQVRAHTVLDPAGLSVDSQVQVLGGGENTNNATKRLSTEMWGGNPNLLGLVAGGDHRVFGLDT